MPEINHRSAARKLMKDRQFEQAIAEFRCHLAIEGDDVGAMIEMGICHLLKGSRETFIAIHEHVGNLISKMASIPADVARLWQQYRSLFVKVTAAGVVLASTSVASAHRYSGGVFIPPDDNPPVQVVDQRHSDWKTWHFVAIGAGGAAVVGGWLLLRRGRASHSETPQTPDSAQLTPPRDIQQK